VYNYNIIFLLGNINEMNFESQIQQWISLDNQLKELNEHAKKLRDNRDSLRGSITAYAGEHGMHDATIKIGDGKLRFVETNVASSLTYKHLEKCLSEIIKNEAQVAQIVEYVKKNREVKTVSEIKRTYTN
jgi:Family of unknown function (DUF5760)